MKFKNLVVLVTGGASGIGEAVVRMLIPLESKVIACDLQQEKGLELEKEFNGKLKFINCDITNEKDTEDMINTIEKEYGRLDCVVNSAGIGGFDFLSSETKVHSKALFDLIMNVNTFGTFNVSRFAARLMIKNVDKNKECNGSIILVSSLAGIEAQKATTAYAASKGALIGMTLPMARDLGKYKIRVNSIAPGIIETPMTSNSGLIANKYGKTLIDSTPLKRFGKASEVADTILFCISNDFINGTTIRIDGGIRLPHF